MTKNQKLILTGLAVEYAVKAVQSTKQPLHARVTFVGRDNVILATCLIGDGQQIDYPVSFQTADALSRSVKIEQLNKLTDIQSESIDKVIVEDITSGSSLVYPRVINGLFIDDYLTRLKQSQTVNYDAWSAAIRNAIQAKPIPVPKKAVVQDQSQVVKQSVSEVNVYDGQGVSKGVAKTAISLNYNPLGLIRTVLISAKEPSDIKKGLCLEYLTFLHFVAYSLNANKGYEFANRILELIVKELEKAGKGSTVSLVERNGYKYLDIKVSDNADMSKMFTQGFTAWIIQNLGVRFTSANLDWITYAGFTVDDKLSNFFDKVLNYGKSLTSYDRDVLIKAILGGIIFDKLYGTELYNSIVNNNKITGNYFAIFSVLAMNSILLINQQGVKNVVTTDVDQLFNTQDSVNYYLQPVVTGPNTPKGLALYPMASFGEVYSQETFGRVPVSSGVYSFGSSSYKEYVEKIARDVSVVVFSIGLSIKDAVSFGALEERLFQTSDVLLQFVNAFDVGIITDTIISHIGANGLNKNPFVTNLSFKPSKWYSLGEIINDNTITGETGSEQTQRLTEDQATELYAKRTRSKLAEYQIKRGNDEQYVDLYIDNPDTGVEPVENIRELYVGG